MALFKQKLTKDEIAIIIGVLLSAGVAGVGIYQMYIARIVTTMPDYIWFLVTGAMLFDAGAAGVIGMLAIYFNYRAIL